MRRGGSSPLLLHFSLLSVSFSVCLSLHLFVSPSVCLSVSVYLSVCLYVCLSVYLSVSPVSLFVCMSLYLCLSRYLYLSMYLFVCLSMYLLVCLSVPLSVYLSLYLSFSLHPSLCLMQCDSALASSTLLARKQSALTERGWWGNGGMYAALGPVYDEVDGEICLQRERDNTTGHIQPILFEFLF